MSNPIWASSPEPPDLDTEPPTIAAARRTTGARLAEAGHASPGLEADLLLGAVTGRDRTHLIARGEQPLERGQAHALERLLMRRLAGEPIAYLIGTREFWSLALKVSPATLIPRPETETLVEHVLASLPEHAPLRVIDLGTGSGAIAAALAQERPDWQLLGIEASAAALAIAAANRARLGVTNLALLQGDWSAALAASAVDALVANPPYVRENDPHLEQGDLRFEPRSALAAGVDGLDAMRAIIAAAPRCLRPDGLLALEHGWDQASAVRALLVAQGFGAVTTVRDLAGQDRVTSARLARE